MNDTNANTTPKTKSILITGVRMEEASNYFLNLQENNHTNVHKCALHILVFDLKQENKNYIKLIKNYLPHWKGQITIQAPPEFSNHKNETIVNQVTSVAQYLTQVYVPQQVQPKDHEWIRFLWREDWAQWSAAATAASIGLVRASMFTTPRHGPWSPVLPTEAIINERLKINHKPSNALEELVGDSKEIKKIKERIRQYAELSMPVLIVGETGTGKELCARALHELSNRRGKFAQHNGALLNRERAESDLFGHVKGAFTGADKDRLGRIEEAKDGTFFLDELGRVPTDVQAKLLRALNEAEDGKVGVVKMGERSSDLRRLSVRFVGALQNDDDVLPDLYYRVAALRIWIPPLRERPEDIETISDHFIQSFKEKIKGSGPTYIHRKTHELLRSHTWPGNIRQLKLVLRQAWLEALLNGDDSISPAHVEPFLMETRRLPATTSAAERRDLPKEIAHMVSEAIEEAEKRFRNNQTEAARWLGLETGQKLERWKKRYSDSKEDMP
jgi:DNA-binding NtrC family response regulator